MLKVHKYTKKIWLLENRSLRVGYSIFHPIGNIYSFKMLVVTRALYKLSLVFRC